MKGLLGRLVKRFEGLYAVWPGRTLPLRGVSGGWRPKPWSLSPQGIAEMDQVKLSSAMRQPGNGIPFLFLGSISADAFSGSIHLGEYLTAKFTANRSS